MSDSDDENCGKVIRVTFLGESSTGKSCICNRYLGRSEPSGPTQGVEVISGECLSLQPRIPLQICDVAGNALDTNMFDNYLYGSDIVIFVYDLTTLSSFDKLPMWVDKVNNFFLNETKKPLMAIFGNKSDLEHQRAVRLSCVENFAKQNSLDNFKGSARTGDMVDTCITSLIAKLSGLEMKPAAKHMSEQSTSSASGVNGHSNNVATESENPQPLIMNRKALRRIQRKASSSVCCLQ